MGDTLLYTVFLSCSLVHVPSLHFAKRHDFTLALHRQCNQPNLGSAAGICGTLGLFGSWRALRQPKSYCWHTLSPGRHGGWFRRS